MSCTLKEKILGLDARVPRYTSYPTAPHFKAIETQSNIYTNALRALPEQTPISLYVHIPFCPKLCWYCGCSTKITRQYAPIEAYTKLITKEIALIAAQLTHKPEVSHIHFGGGSPSYLKAQDFGLIMTRIRSAFNVQKDAEIAIEVDPRNVNEARIASYAKSGVNRISLGVQDFDKDVLQSVNRQQPYHLSYEAVKMFREYGINDINVDLIYGLPHQTCESMKKTISLIDTLSPSRLALFGYAHVPWMKKHMRLIEENTLPDKDLRYDLFEAAGQELKSLGYNAIGIDHFAKPGDSLNTAASNGTMRRNFQGYTTDATSTLIGIGASSIGKLPGLYAQNSPDMPSYKAAVTSGNLPIAKYCPLTKEDDLRSDLIERLMCDFTVNLRSICKKHGVADDHFAGEVERLKVYERLGFVELSGDQITIPQDAKIMARTLCSVFDRYLAESAATPRHASAV